MLVKRTGKNVTFDILFLRSFEILKHILNNLLNMKIIKRVGKVNILVSDCTSYVKLYFRRIVFAEPYLITDLIKTFVYHYLLNFSKHY